jgi:hypothetical protein
VPRKIIAQRRRPGSDRPAAALIARLRAGSSEHLVARPGSDRPAVHPLDPIAPDDRRSPTHLPTLPPQIATVAKALGKPFYVGAESYKFARLFPLNQRDLPLETRPLDLGAALPDGAVVENPTRDYTPPHLITLLFTDLGVLTPSAVSDELIQLYL